MKSKTIILIIIALVIAAAVFFLGFTIHAPADANFQYFCNQKLMSFALNIDVEDMNSNKLYNINGELFSSYEEDLAMTDNCGDVVLSTDDQFNWVTQNDHTIRCGDEILYHCNGEFKVFADSYRVTDKDGNAIATVKFNMFDTVGIMEDNEGNTIARYDSAIFRYDYIVSIYDNCNIDDESVLMIFASYVSDVRADSD